MGAVTMTEREELTRVNVLIIEDDADVRISLQTILEEEGFAVTSASNGAEAMELLSRSRLPDVILLDLILPELDGWQFLRKRAEDRSLARVPVIAISAVSYRGAPGAEVVLPKPINSDALIGLIRQVRSGVPAANR